LCTISTGRRERAATASTELMGVAGTGSKPSEVRAALSGLAQPLFGVFGQQIAQ